jgi:catecholate siderophore receptor
MLQRGGVVQPAAWAKHSEENSEMKRSRTIWKITSTLLIVCSFLALVFCVAPVVCAQQTAVAAAQLRGRVVDSGQLPIKGANVAAVTTDGGNVVASAVTDANGDFSLDANAGTYRLKISAMGFTDAAQMVIFTQAGSDGLRIVLDVAPVHTAVTVSASPGYQTIESSTGTRTLTPLRDVPQSITVVTQELIKDQAMLSMSDVVRYMPGVTSIQGENNRDQLVIRGNSTSADFFLNGVRDDVQYYRDLYNTERIEALKGPNAMVFGRGGGGGVINRVTKDADFTPLRDFTLEGGSFNSKRFTTDLDQPLSANVAARFNGMYENSATFRDFGHLERFGVNPTMTFTPASRTRITVGYEHFSDHRGADRGVTSFQGLPADVPITTFYGNPDYSKVRALVDLGSITVEQRGSRWNLRNRSLFGGYDRGYQNFVPGAVNAAKAQVALTGYNNATARMNVFNQTDFTYTASTWGIRHTLLGGAELGQQLTNNLRNTAFFNGTATTVNVPYSNPTIFTPVAFLHAATDANNHLKTGVAATYVQDQVELSRYFQVVAGLRFDHFDLRFHDNNSGNNLRRIDNLVSPRAGIVFKPIVPVSIYWNYAVSYLPSSGDQFSSLTTVTQQVQPEKFTNYELGAKWDANRYISLTTALYRLDRTNTRSTDPNNPAAIIQTGSTRNLGYEIGLSGRITRAWSVAGGYAYQNSFISSATTSSQRGFKVGQVPHNSFSLWNNYQVISRLRLGLGLVNRSDMFVAVDNTVTLPGYTRADGAVFFNVTERSRLQVNVENLFNTTYYINADSNTNISPGSPRAVRAALVVGF